MNEKIIKSNEVLIFSLIENLQKDIEQVEKEIIAMQKIIAFAKTEYEKVKNPMHEFRTGTIISDAESDLYYMQDRKKEFEEKLKQYQGISREKKIQVMHFKAGHHNFDQEELEEMYEKIQKHFNRPPFPCKNVDGGMSDAVALFTEEKVTPEEAQKIMDTIIDTDFNDEPVLFCYCGEPLIRDGLSITQK